MATTVILEPEMDVFLLGERQPTLELLLMSVAIKLEIEVELRIALNVIRRSSYEFTQRSM